MLSSTTRNWTARRHLNGLGVAAQVREWLTTTDKPRLGKAMTLPLELPEGRASEFLL